MTRSGVILDTSQPAELADAVLVFQEAWRIGLYDRFPYPRARWLSSVERMLADFFPQASSRDRNDTARSLAPFPLAEPPTAP